MGAAKLTALAIAVLELLHERPMHPYEMAQLMRERHFESRARVAAGSLYHTVERLLAADYVKIVDTQRDGRRPERTVYGMTEAGRDAFVERAQVMLSVPATEYPEFLSGLGVVDELGPADAILQLRHRELHLRADVALDQAVLETLIKNETPPVYWLDWRFASDRRAFELAWTTRLIADLESGAVPFIGDHPCPKDRTLVPKEKDDEKAS